MTKKNKTKPLNRKEKKEQARVANIEAIRKRRLIAEHQERLKTRTDELQDELRPLKIRYLETPAVDENPIDEDEELNVESKDSSQTVSDDLSEHNPLWVLEPEDLNELSLSEVRCIWDNRTILCGSIEVAAEALAILRVDRGEDPAFRGWQSVINDSELQPLRNELPSLYALDQINIKATPADSPLPSQPPQISQDVAPSNSAEEIKPHRLTRDEVLKLPQAALQDAWERRPYSFLTLSAASEALATIRFLSGIDLQKRPWSAFTESNIIQAMYDLLEDDSDSAPLTANSEAESSIIGLDQRTRSSRVQVLRIGQKEFRNLVVTRYSGRCCFTGCTEAAVLEAAHIMPYMGDHSNLIDNGLLLRVDLHRLFDRFLISVNPDNLSLAISKSLNDAYYLSLSGRSLSVAVTNLTRQFLKRHYDTFIKVNK